MFLKRQKTLFKICALLIIAIGMMFASNSSAWLPTQSYAKYRGFLQLIAGSVGGSGLLPGNQAAARIGLGVSGVAVDSSGNRYITDQTNNVVWKQTSAGTVSVFAGSPTGAHGTADGTGTAALFYGPLGITISSSGTLYVSDNYNHTIRSISSTGVVTTIAGLAGTSGSTNATGTAARFKNPNGLALDSAGANLYIADQGNSTIRKMTLPGAVVTLFAGTVGSLTFANGTTTSAKFYYPTSLVLDSSGNVFVADESNSRIREISGTTVTTFAGSGVQTSTDGTGAAATFSNPYGITIDSSNNLYVTDSLTSVVRKITPSAVVTTIMGASGSKGSTDGTGTAARFYYPYGITIDSSNNLFIADYQNATLRMATSSFVTSTVAGKAPVAGSANGTQAAASFSGPQGLVAGPDGTLYVADRNNHVIRKITAGGVVTTLAGTMGTSGSTDGTGTAAKFSQPNGVTFGSDGNLYVADTGNQVVRMVTTAGVVTTLAGSVGSYGNVDGTGTAAKFQGLIAITGDNSGNLYVIDQFNSKVRKITLAGVVTSLAGGNYGTADGTGTAAQFSFAAAQYGGICADSAGNIYVADLGAFTIRKITSAGVVTTIAGAANIPAFLDGNGTASRFTSPAALSIDQNNNLYITDSNRIRRIDTAGNVVTYNGSSSAVGMSTGYLTGATFNVMTAIAVQGNRAFIIAENSIFEFALPF